MAKGQQLNLPQTPTYYQNPLQQGDIGTQSGLFHQLTSGQFGQGAGGDLSWLQSLINPNNSQNALSAAQGILQPQFRDTLNQINQQAANNNQLNSSTYTDALARSQSDLNSQYQSIVSQQAINDSNQSNANKLNLFGLGLNTGQQAIGNESQDTNSHNQFDLENYQNQVAAAIAGQKQQNGGFAGALSGGLGGALGGFALGGPVGALIGGVGGGLAGGLSPQSSGIGGQLFAGGSGLEGGSMMSGGNRIFGGGLGQINDSAFTNGLGGIQNPWSQGNYNPGSSASNFFTPSLRY